MEDLGSFGNMLHIFSTIAQIFGTMTHIIGTMLHIFWYPVAHFWHHAAHFRHHVVFDTIDHFGLYIIHVRKGRLLAVDGIFRTLDNHLREEFQKKWKMSTFFVDMGGSLKWISDEGGGGG